MAENWNRFWISLKSSCRCPEERVEINPQTNLQVA